MAMKSLRHLVIAQEQEAVAVNQLNRVRQLCQRPRDPVVVVARQPSLMSPECHRLYLPIQIDRELDDQLLDDQLLGDRRQPDRRRVNRLRQHYQRQLNRRQPSRLSQENQDPVPVVLHSAPA